MPSSEEREWAHLVAKLIKLLGAHNISPVIIFIIEHKHNTMGNAHCNVANQSDVDFPVVTFNNYDKFYFYYHSRYNIG
jgi:hypothetical protein